MQEFGPRHETHRRIPWPDHLISGTIMLPDALIPLLSHNDVPCHSQAIYVEDLQKSTQKRLANTNEMLLGIEEGPKRQALQIQQHLLQKQSFSCKVILSAFRRLPQDIIYNITLHCEFGETPRLDDSLAPIVHHCPFVLASISKSWRNTLSRMSTIWSNIHPNSSRTFDKNLSLIKSCSRLSSPRPIKVHWEEIIEHPKERDENLDMTPHILPWILSDWDARSRLTCLSIRTNLDSALIELLHQLADDGVQLPNVRSFLLLVVFGPNNMQALPTIVSVDLLSFIFPQLSYLWLRHSGDVAQLREEGMALCIPTPIICARWLSRLTRLFADIGIRAEEYINILRYCTNLEVASLSIGCWDPYRQQGGAQWLMNSTTSRPTIIHRKLTKLTVQYVDYRGHILLPFFPFQFPKLECLHVYFASSRTRSSGLLFDNTYPEAIPPELWEKNFANMFPVLKNARINVSVLFSVVPIFPLLSVLPPTTILGVTHLDAPMMLRDLLGHLLWDTNRSYPLAPILKQLEIMPSFRCFSSLRGAEQWMQVIVDCQKPRIDNSKNPPDHESHRDTASSLTKLRIYIDHHDERVTKDVWDRVMSFRSRVEGVEGLDCKLVLLDSEWCDAQNWTDYWSWAGATQRFVDLFN